MILASVSDFGGGIDDRRIVHRRRDSKRRRYSIQCPLVPVTFHVPPTFVSNCVEPWYPVRIRAAPLVRAASMNVTSVTIGNVSRIHPPQWPGPIVKNRFQNFWICSTPPTGWFGVSMID